MNIFEALRKDHDLQRKLVDQLIETHGKSDEREKLFQWIKAELKSHATAEERCFYVPLMQHDMTQEKSRHSIAEHHEMDEMLEKLEKTEHSSPAWLVEAKNLQHRVHHHLDEEELEVFQLGGRVLTDAQKADLADEYQQEMTEQKAKDW